VFVMEVIRAAGPWEDGGPSVELDNELGEDGLKAEPLSREAARTGVEGGLVMSGARLERVGVVQVIF
jgi:hypothetical protein